MIESELKFRLASQAEHDRLRERLIELGADPQGVRQEENWILDDAQRRLRARGTVLRVRRLDGGPAGVLTVKGQAAFEGAVKLREEQEVAVEDAAGVARVLNLLGFGVAIEYQKRREEWRLGDVHVALDELEFGSFCEIEGPPGRLAAVARALGLDDGALEPNGYPRLMCRHLEAIGSG